METEVASLSALFPFVDQDKGVAMTTEEGEHIFDYLGDS
tara:strand:- start:2818 stop:2934 length:117 start_codon:yes stop_codon:yes gene_type:complete